MLQARRGKAAPSVLGFARPAALACLGDSFAIVVHAARWEPERPGAKSLRLLPSGPDRVGDNSVRPTPAPHMGERAAGGKIGGNSGGDLNHWLMIGPCFVRCQFTPIHRMLRCHMRYWLHSRGVAGSILVHLVAAGLATNSTPPDRQETPVRPAASFISGSVINDGLGSKWESLEVRDLEGCPEPARRDPRSTPRLLQWPRGRLVVDSGTIVCVLLDQHGRVREARLLDRTVSTENDQELLLRVRAARFTPARLDEQAVPTWHTFFPPVPPSLPAMLAR